MFRKAFQAGSALLLVLLVSMLAAPIASAHGHTEVGDYELVIGFHNEPAYQGEPNGLDLFVTNKTTGEKIKGLEDTLKAEILFGGAKKELKVKPQWGEDGAYTAYVLPTSDGDYTWHIFGSIENTPVDVSMTSSPDTFSAVQAKSTVAFPAPEATAAELQAQAAAIRLARRAPEQTLPLATLIPRFSRLALVCVLLLTLTGVYSYVQHINRLDLLTATTYGRALLVKVGLFVVLLLIGALNLLVLSPRLRAGGGRVAAALGRTARAELMIGALVLLLAGVMTSVAPSQAAWAEHERQGIVESARVGNVNLVLHVAPAQVGPNAFAVQVDDPRANAQNAPSKLLLRFTSLDMDMGTTQADAEPVEQGRYTAQGSYLSMNGRWQIEVILRRAGFEDVRHTFDLTVGKA